MKMPLPQTEPSISCGILKIWILSRQFPDATDYWDGNWLNVIAHCSDKGAAVTVSGSIIHLREIATLRAELLNMDESLKGSAEMPTIEPNLHLKLDCNHLGHIAGECHITPDHMTQSHSFDFDLDQSYLKHLIRQCDRVLEEYPVRDAEDQKAQNKRMESNS